MLRWKEQCCGVSNSSTHCQEQRKDTIITTVSYQKRSTEAGESYESPYFAVLRCLYNRFQFACVAQRVFDDHLAEILALAAIFAYVGSIRKEDVAVSDNPTSVSGKLNDIALGLEE